ncbi:MAG: hypothetical protein U9N85_04650 [Bacteroidota bacterium]|nr:hypothetical protein [Bacteroidota bacterium]
MPKLEENGTYSANNYPISEINKNLREKNLNMNKKKQGMLKYLN